MTTTTTTDPTTATGKARRPPRGPRSRSGAGATRLSRGRPRVLACDGCPTGERPQQRAPIRERESAPKRTRPSASLPLRSLRVFDSSPQGAVGRRGDRGRGVDATRRRHDGPRRVGAGLFPRRVHVPGGSRSPAQGWGRAGSDGRLAPRNRWPRGRFRFRGCPRAARAPRLCRGGCARGVGDIGLGADVSGRIRRIRPGRIGRRPRLVDPAARTAGDGPRPGHDSRRRRLGRRTDGWRFGLAAVRGCGLAAGGDRRRTRRRGRRRRGPRPRDAHGVP